MVSFQITAIELIHLLNSQEPIRVQFKHALVVRTEAGEVEEHKGEVHREVEASGVHARKFEIYELNLVVVRVRDQEVSRVDIVVAHYFVHFSLGDLAQVSDLFHILGRVFQDVVDEDLKLVDVGVHST
jgi:hypothetical protein